MDRVRHADYTAEDLTDPFVVWYSHQPEMIAAILEAHTPDDHGDCGECSGEMRSVKWPCVHVWHAEGAKRLRQVRRNRASS